jgi:hypothetical protein
MIVTTWNVVPDYDTWGIDTSWNCDNWVQWHKELKKRFGGEKANSIWNYAFSLQSDGAKAFDCRTFNSAFRSYMTQESLDPYASAGVFSLILKPVGAGGDLIESGSEIISNFGKGVSNFFKGNTVQTLITIGLVGVVGYYGFKFYKATKE